MNLSLLIEERIVTDQRFVVALGIMLLMVQQLLTTVLFWSDLL